MKNKKFKSFTLAEAITIFIILGIVAVVTLPVVINQSLKNSNRVKLKKALQYYEQVMEKTVVEGDLRNMNSVKALYPDDDCDELVKLFKYTVRDGCTIKTSDGVYWDLSKIDAPYVAFDSDSLRKDFVTEDNETTFGMVSVFDDNGSIRVNDLNYVKNKDLYAEYAILNKTMSYAFKTQMEDSNIDVVNFGKDPIEILIQPGETRIVTVTGADRTYTYTIKNDSDSPNVVSFGKTIGMYGERTYISGSNISVNSDNGNERISLKGNKINYKGGNGDKSVIFEGNDMSIDLGDGDNCVATADFYPKACK